MSLINDATLAVEKHNMLSQGDIVLVALSGGSDSCVLLHWLLQVKESFEIRVCAAHYNHMLRGQEALDDLEFCGKLCKSWNVPLVIGQGDVRKTANNLHIGIEECARNMRYAFLTESANNLGATKIATAHTASDNFETVVFNLARGTGLNGTCGIAPVRNNIIRPLIFTDKESVLEYASENNLEFVTDSTNAELGYTRNYIRHKIAPLFHELNPSFINAFIKMSESARQDMDYLNQVSKQLYEKALNADNTLNLEILRTTHSPILIRTICLYAKSLNTPELNSKQIKDILYLIENGHTSQKCQLSGGFFAILSYNSFFIDINKNSSPDFLVNLKFGINKITSNSFLEIFENSLKNNDNSIDKIPINYDKIKGSLLARPRQTGDIFVFPATGHSKSLKELFIDKKIPKAKRDILPIVVDENNEVVFVPGIGVSKKFSNFDNDSNVIFISYKSEKGEF